MLQSSRIFNVTILEANKIGFMEADDEYFFTAFYGASLLASRVIEI
jgi:hypothetical protein